MSGLSVGTSPDPRSLHQAGLAALRAGRVADALENLGRAAVAAPGNAAIQSALGDAHRAGGRLEVALSHYRNAASSQPNAATLTNLAGVLLALGRASDAARTYQAAFRHDQRSPELLYGWGLALRALGRLSEAADAFSRAVVLRADFEPAHAELAETCMLAQAWDLGLKAASDGLARCDSRRLRIAFVDCARRSPPFAHPGLTERLHQALAEGWTRPRDLARLACAMLAADVHLGPSDPLLRLALTLAPAADAGLERQLARRRHDLLMQQVRPATDGLTPGVQWLDEACLLARQCFINEYVWTVGPAERDAVAVLRRQVQASLDSGVLPQAHHLAALALYQPLGELAEVEAQAQAQAQVGVLASSHWPAPLEAVIDQQVRRPAEEAGLMAQLVSVGAILDPVSQRVRAQYEESPYPRWVALAAPPEPVRLETWLAGRFPQAPPPAGELRTGPLEVLVAGCGTGQQAVETARGFAPARVLAIDLSRRSLAYAARMSGTLGLGDIAYLRADLLQAASLGRDFDLVSVGGVLHHLADPFAGWRALCGVLRPGGVMNVLVYTERGRADVVRARDWIARQGLERHRLERQGVEASPDWIRRCRSALLEVEEDWARRLVESPDFWSISLCRDLLFHTHEQALTLPSIARFLGEAGLELIGVEVAEETEQAFLAEAGTGVGADGGPGRLLRDLARWDAFEAANPHCFASMLNLWLRRPSLR